MTLEDIQELADYKIPEIAVIPNEYKMTDAYFDEYMEMTYIYYERDYKHMLMLSVYPSKEAYGELYIVGKTQESFLEIAESI